MSDTPQPPPDAVEALFERLDAAFARLNAGAGQPPAPVARPAEAAPAVTGPSTSDGAGDVPPAGLLAEAFTALLALEEGEPGARPVRLAPADSAAPPAPPALSDSIIDEVARRVAERLGTEAVKALVADTVLEVAERLVREEIDRIRQTPHA